MKRLAAYPISAMAFGLNTHAVSQPTIRADAPALPIEIRSDALGHPSFEENFTKLDAGADQIRPLHPHRWRTVFGSGGPTMPSNRSLGGLSIGVDADYQGSPSEGADKAKPLGINPFSIGPTGLTITARRVAPAVQPRLFGRAWATGQLTTKFSFAQKQGYFEAEMDLPACEKGAWPALWLMPAQGPWPRHGEIDFPETIGDGKVYWTVHTGQGGQYGHTQLTTKGDCTRGWHRYGVMWRPDVIGFYYDGSLIGQTKTPSDFTEPMFLIVNLTIGGSWPGPPDPSATQMTMRVRYVKAWPLPD